MNNKQAKKIGVIKSLKSATIGVIIIYVFSVFVAQEKGLLASLYWIFTYHYRLNVLIGILIFYALAYIFGKKAGYEILIEKRKYYKLIGVKYALIVLIISAFLFGWTGYFQEGIQIPEIFLDAPPEFIEKYRTMENPFIDYVAKPFYWIIFIGIIPALLVGMLFGRSIKNSS